MRFARYSFVCLSGFLLTVPVGAAEAGQRVLTYGFSEYRVFPTVAPAFVDTTRGR